MLWYVSTPYSKYARGIEAAFIDACRAAGALIRRGENVYSPIAATHPIAIHGGIDPYDHALWIPLDRHIMQAADGCIVVMMDGWKESRGIEIEIDIFRQMGKPIRYFEWPSMHEVEHDEQ